MNATNGNDLAGRGLKRPGLSTAITTPVSRRCGVPQRGDVQRPRRTGSSGPAASNSHPEDDGEAWR